MWQQGATSLRHENTGCTIPGLMCQRCQHRLLVDSHLLHSAVATDIDPAWDESIVKCCAEEVRVGASTPAFLQSLTLDVTQNLHPDPYWKGTPRPKNPSTKH